MEFRWFIGSIVTLLILGGSMLIAWGRIKQKMVGQCKELETLKKQVRNEDGSPNFVPVLSCDKNVARIEKALADADKKRETARGEMQVELQKISVFMGRIEGQLSKV